MYVSFWMPLLLLYFLMFLYLGPTSVIFVVYNKHIISIVSDQSSGIMSGLITSELAGSQVRPERPMHEITHQSVFVKTRKLMPTKINLFSVSLAVFKKSAI